MTRALSRVPTVEVELDAGTGLLLADDLEPVAEPPPWVALLPALDPTMMGWQGRDWYLGGHRPALFDRSGNAGPSAWADGRVVGGWAQRRDGEVVVRLLEDVGRERTAALTEAAERLGRVAGSGSGHPPVPDSPRTGAVGLIPAADAGRRPASSAGARRRPAALGQAGRKAPSSQGRGVTWTTGMGWLMPLMARLEAGRTSAASGSRKPSSSCTST